MILQQSLQEAKESGGNNEDEELRRAMELSMQDAGMNNDDDLDPELREALLLSMQPDTQTSQNSDNINQPPPPSTVKHDTPDLTTDFKDAEFVRSLLKDFDGVDLSEETLKELTEKNKDKKDESKKEPPK